MTLLDTFIREVDDGWMLWAKWLLPNGARHWTAQLYATREAADEAVDTPAWRADQLAQIAAITKT